MLYTFRARDTFVSQAGGFMEVLSEDGEPLLTLDIPPGRVSCRDFADYVPGGRSYRLSEGVALYKAKNGVGRVHYGPGSHDSGANPDFQPTSASRLEKQMRLQLAHMQQATNRLEARAKALAKIERIPTAQPAQAPQPAPVKEEGGEVVE